MKELLKLYSIDISTLLIRITTGVVTFVDGMQNFFESKPTSTLVKTDPYEIPLLITLSLYVLQAVISLGLILGLATRKSAVLLMFIVVVSNLLNRMIISGVSISVNLGTDQMGLTILLLTMFLTLYILGGGKWSVDNLKGK